MLQNHLWQRVIQGQFLQHLFLGGGRSLGGFFQNRYLKLFEQYLAELFWGCQVKLLSGQVPGLGFQLCQPLGQFLALLEQQGVIHQCACALYSREHGNQR